MGFGDAVKLGFANYVNFSGRASRSEYWYWSLFGLIGVLATDNVMIGRLFIAPIFVLALILPSFSLTVRRFHDLDRSGWWILLALIPMVGHIIVAIWFCFKGTDGPNRFDADRLSAGGR